MSRNSIKSDQLFFPALMLSLSAHIFAIAGGSWVNFSPDYSVVQAPNSLDFTVVSQPRVSVIEEDIVTEEIIEQEVSENINFKSVISNEVAKEIFVPDWPSQESKGAVTKAKPLMQANSAPPYPMVARKKGWEGIVRLKVLVEQNGAAEQVNIQESSGHTVLDKAAVKAVRTWQFQPARSGRLRFSSKIIIPIQFTLKKP